MNQFQKSLSKVAPWVLIISLGLNVGQYISNHKLVESLQACAGMYVNQEQLEIERQLRKYRPDISTQQRLVLARGFAKASKEYKIDARFLMAVADYESRFHLDAISPKGAIGVMQVMPFWHKELDFISSPLDLHNVELNIRAGAHILKQYSQLPYCNRDVRHTLLCYNRGPGTVRKLVKAGLDPSNGYAGQVFHRVTKLVTM